MRIFRIAAYVLTSTFCLSSHLFADVVQLDNKPFKCAEADAECKEAIKEITTLHWEKHKTQAELAIETQKFSAAQERKKIALERKALEEALRDAAKALNSKIQQESANELALLERKLSGLRFVSASLSSPDKDLQPCDALPFVRYHCALTSSCTTTADKICPTKMSCELVLKDKSICYLPPSASEPKELKVTYTCNDGEEVSEEFSARSDKIYFACDLR